jgi:thiol-disulfide isomerase/thioredoxin
MKITPWMKALVASLVLSFLVAFGLYYFSEQFFKAKNKQTLITSSDLGKVVDSDIILPVGEKVPDFELKDVMSPSQSLERLLSENKTIKIVNFWASWCEPCVEEFSSFARLIRAYDGQLSFYGVGQDKTMKESKDFIEAFSTEFEGLNEVYFLFDENRVTSKSYGVLALPETFIVGRDGKLLKRVTGFFDWDQDQVKVFFDNVLSSRGRM